MDAGAPMNYVVVARVAGGLSEACLRVGLDAAQARHPALRARVTEADGELRFVSEGVGPIPLSVQRGPETLWRSEVEANLVRRYPGQGPLLRAVLCEHEDEDAVTLLLGTHHVIGDGRSGECLLRDVLQAAGRALAGESPELQPLSDMQTMEDRWPAHTRGFGAWFRRRFFIARVVSQAIRLGRPLLPRVDRPVFAHSRETRLIPVLLGMATLARLEQRCRAEATSVHGALSAALVLAIMDDQQCVKPTTIGLGIPVNMRARLDPPVGDMHGYFVSVIPFNTRLDPAVPFWQFARAVKAHVAKSRKRYDDFAVAGIALSLARQFGMDTLPPREFVERWEEKMLGTGGLTNMGRLGLPTNYGALTLETCHFVFTPSALATFSSSANTFAGRLHWNFMWPDPSMTEQHANALVRQIMERLEHAIAS
jgi:NRPS condensation-like uncharacterized protein